jgi:hypothetical protein
MTNAKTNWLDRRVSYPGPYLCLVLDQDELDSALKHCKRKPSEYFPDSGAKTYTLENAEGELVCIVGVSKASQSMDSIVIAGLLVHEAVHVWQDYCQGIGEHAPAREQEAYAIQGISQELMAEYARRIA